MFLFSARGVLVRACVRQRVPPKVVQREVVHPQGWAPSPLCTGRYGDTIGW